MVHIWLKTENNWKNSENFHYTEDKRVCIKYEALFFSNFIPYEW